MFFSWLDWAYKFGAGKSQRCHLNHIISKGTYYQHDLTVDTNHLAKLGSVRLLLCKVTHLSPPIWYSINLLFKLNNYMYNNIYEDVCTSSYIHPHISLLIFLKCSFYRLRKIKTTNPPVCGSLFYLLPLKSKNLWKVSSSC